MGPQFSYDKPGEILEQFESADPRRPEDFKLWLSMIIWYSHMAPMAYTYAEQ